VTEVRLTNRMAIAVLALIHLAVNLWHGNAHTVLAVGLSTWQTAFVFLVILIAPVVAAGLVWTRYHRVGVRLFFLSMLGALLFGLYYHYILVSPDNVAHLPPGSTDAHSTFAASAAALAVLEFISALYGAFCLRPSRAPRG